MATNTQLWGFDPAGNKIKLDLYETDPIKLTFTAETLTDLPTINSTYSQTFRMPATGINNQFFKHWFFVNSNDFDVSQKTAAEIVTEAGFFIEGQIRLQKVYRNYQSDLIDYEVLFLGEVRDFATQVGEGMMNTINCNDLAHTLNYSNITTSWNAIPLTGNGLKQGNVVYPLAEYGYTYDNNGTVLIPQVQADGAGKPFTSNSHPLELWQWRPWIRAKYLIDKIFSTTDYTYSSVFFESYNFNNLYINATGNTATASMLDLVSTNTMEVAAGDQTYGTLHNELFYWQWPNEVFDNGNNWSTPAYTAPLTGNYTFQYDFIGDTTWVNIGGGTGAFPTVTVTAHYWINNTIYNIGLATNGGTDPAVDFAFTNTLNLALTAGQTVKFGYKVQRAGNTVTYLFNTTLYANTLRVTSAPVSVNPGTLLSDKVKTIDWFRSILKKFRLVMVPDRENPKNFIIEPWQNYIGSGDQLDWTHKLDGSKDIQFEPLFFTQSATIKFTDQEDSDHANDNHQKVFKEVYGTRIYDSLNDLLKEQRVIDTIFAPTPVERIEKGNGAPATYDNNIIIPHLAKLDPVDGTAGGRLTPIVAKPRLLYWNGLKANAFVGNHQWHMKNDAGTAIAQTQYPMMSYMSQFPTTSNTINLSWELEYPRFIEPPVAINGQDVYNLYWKGYIDSTYSKDARKMTATFILDAQDLTVQFNDSIFIRDSWWRILKITDAPLTGLNPVKVELIKLLNAPDDTCTCQQYAVSDNRLVPESIYYFNYTDCNGNPATGQVYQNSVVVCACEPFASGEPEIYVTATGTACGQVGPGNPTQIDIAVSKGTEPGGAILVQKSTTGVGDWTSVIEQDLPIGPYETSLKADLTEGDFVRIGYQSITPAQFVVVNWYKNGELNSQTRFEPNGTFQYSVCPEKILSTDVWTTDVAITEI